MTISTIRKGKSTVLDIDRSTQDPVGEVLACLEEMKVPGYEGRVVINLAGLKPCRMGGVGGLERLFEQMPHQGETTFVIAVPESLVEAASAKASDYVASIARGPRPNYIVATKESAQRIANQ